MFIPGLSETVTRIHRKWWWTGRWNSLAATGGRRVRQFLSSKQDKNTGDAGTKWREQRGHWKLFREGWKTGRNSKTRCSGSLAGRYGNGVALRGDTRRERWRRPPSCRRGTLHAQDRRSEC